MTSTSIPLSATESSSIAKNDVNTNSSSWVPSWLKKPIFGYAQMMAEILNMTQDEKWVVARDLYGATGNPIGNNNNNANANAPGLHNVNHAVTEETPQIITMLLQLFEEVLSELEEKEAFELGEFVNPELVTSSKFRLMFLRADHYNPEAAAKRYVLYWERKVELFGPDNAFRKITFLLDMDETDMVARDQGGFCVLPHLDNANRALLLSQRKYWDNKSVKSMLKLYWCHIHSALEDEETGDLVQLNGFVGILTNEMSENAVQSLGYETFFNLNSNIYTDTFSVLPMKTVAIHQFFTRPWEKLIGEQNCRIMGRSLRSRWQLYEGPPKQNLQRLSEYGIRADILPSSLGGTLEYNYQMWLQDKLFREDEELGWVLADLDNQRNKNNGDMDDDFDFDDDLNSGTISGQGGPMAMDDGDY